MDDPLAIYLHDHLAGSRFAIELLSSLEKKHQGEPLAGVVGDVRAAVEQDQQVLQDIVDHVGTTHVDASEAAGWLTEKVAQLKLGRDTGQGLGTLEAFETLTLGIRGKMALWRALPLIRQFDPRIPAKDFDTLIERAGDQFDRLEEQRLKLLPSAFRPAP